MNSIAKLFVRTARTQLAAKTTYSKALLNTRVSAFTQIPRNNFWKKEKEEDDVEKEFKEAFEEEAANQKKE